MKKRGLGRGLDALLINDEENQATPKTSSNSIAIDQLRPGNFQPRKIFNQESIDELYRFNQGSRYYSTHSCEDDSK